MIRFTSEAIAQWCGEHPEPAAGGIRVVRVAVTPGGCAGLKYVMENALEPRPGELRFEQEGLAIVCAPADLPRLDGLVVDYVDAMVGGGYRFENPNAGRSCGCGASFEERPGEPSR